jgi:hypothetical protein
MFQGVDSLAPNSAWAVGNATSASSTQPILEHWNGAQWSLITLPAGVGANDLTDISGTSPNNLWAVGDVDASTGGPLVLHRTAAGWTSVKAPGEGSTPVLTAVTVVSASDVWAVGLWYGSDQTTHGFLEQWDGKRWSIVHGAPMHGESALVDVSGDAPNDVWAVGYENYDEGSASDDSFIEHSDGHTWTRVTSPNPWEDNGIATVTAVSPDDVWTSYPSGGMQHRDGSTWTVTRLSVYFGINSASADSAKDAWTVGLHNTGVRIPEAQHWNGTKWTRVYLRSSEKRDLQ